MKQRLILIITLLVLVLGLGGAVGWWYFLGPGSGGAVMGVEAAQEAAPEPTPEPEVEVPPTEVPVIEPEVVEETEPELRSSALQGCVTIRVLNARIGPGKDYPAASGFGKGECLEFDARSADSKWLRAVGRYAERGDRLWGHADFIVLEGDINSLPVEE